MDFKSFTDKVTTLGSQALAASVEALGKTTDFTYEHIKKTPVMLKVAADFEAVRTEKNLVIFVLGQKDDPISKNILLQLPVLYSRAWIVSATLKLIASEDAPDLVKILETTAPSVLVYREWVLKSKIQGADITAFMSSFDIARAWNPAQSDAPDVETDPLTSHL